MSEEKKPHKDSLSNNGFIRQKIVKQKIPLRQRVRKTLSFFCMGLIFGVAASAAFVVAKPFIESLMVEPTPTEPVTIPPDETEPVLPESDTTPEETTEPLEEIVSSALAENELDIDDYSSLVASLGGVAFEADKSIVSIQVVKEDTDWFDNTFFLRGTLGGIIVLKNETEILIMTRRDALEGASSLNIALNSSVTVKGSIKQDDAIANLAIISVPTEGLEQSYIDQIQPITLGNSNLLQIGDPLIGLGSPLGSVHSTLYGYITDIRRNVQTVDGMTRVLDTDCLAEDGGVMFLVNVKGELVGVMNNQFRPEGSSRFTSAIAISDLKPLLEKIWNGVDKSFLGVRGMEITDRIAEENGMPKGVYVQEAVSNSPAFAAGIQSGDIIVRIEDDEIHTMKEIQNLMNTCSPGQTIVITLQRGGRDEYKEFEFAVTLTGR